MAQLYVRDVPSLRPHARAGADLLQVLWCPFDHPPEGIMPQTALFWRSAASVTEVLTTPPETAVVEWEEYVPEPCLLSPEQVTEYPDSMELGEELPESFYRNELSVAPGWKAGGWASWGYTAPVPRFCPPATPGWNRC
ncbi:hypothetical protein [Streptomyces lavendulae]|uniref:hypothetical protein n=1 Tax=Streptomyces lavendulae TaxID=1914 RepID=UPI0031F0D384